MRKGEVVVMERLKALLETARTYLREVIGEMRKVVWPSRERTAKLTGVVVAMVAIISAFLFVFDFVLGAGAQRFLGR